MSATQDHSNRSRLRPLALTSLALIAGLVVTSLAGVPDARAAAPTSAPATVAAAGIAPAGVAPAGPVNEWGDPLPVNTGKPKIVGTVAAGRKVYVTQGSWRDAEEFSVTWKINGAVQAEQDNWDEKNWGYDSASSEVGGNFTVPTWAVGRKLEAIVTAMNFYGDETSVTVSAGTIKPGSFSKAPNPGLSGTAKVNATLKATAGRWSPSATLRYQWLRNGKPIKGAGRTTYKLVSSDFRKKISVRVTGSRKGYSTLNRTSRSVKINSYAFTVKKKPSISGKKSSGSTLSAYRGSYSPKPSTYSYRWYRGSKPISKATKSKYKLNTADRGKKISVRVTVKRKNYSTITTASSAVTIYKPARTVISRDGTYKVGSKLKPGLYKSTGSGTSCYWERLSGFSGSSYDIEANHFGEARQYVRILASDRGFKTARCGKWTTVPNTGPQKSSMTADGMYRVGIDIKAGTYFGTSSGSSCYWEVLTDFTGDSYDRVDNYFGSANTIIDIPSWAAGVRVSRCGTLRR